MKLFLHGLPSLREAAIFIIKCKHFARSVDKNKFYE